MKFYNRKTELDEFERIWKLCDKSTHFTILSGRRRVGKTELVKKFCEDKDHIYFFIGRKTLPPLLEELSDVARSKIENFPSITKFDEWLKFLLSTVGDNTVIFFDEFQNFKYVDESIFSDFQKIIDSHKEKVNVHIIVAGSHTSLMNKIFSDSKEPLFGRATEKYVLKPLLFKDVAEMLAEIGITDIEEQIQWYSVFGGIPKYYVVAQEQGLHGMDIHSALKILLFKDFAPLKEEARSLLIEDFGSEHASYFSILEAVALGNSEMTTIANKSGINIKSISKYLGILVRDLGYLDYEVPVTEMKPWKSKSGRYFLNDNFFRFWFRYVYRNRSYYEMGNYGIIMDKIQQDFESFVGREFEKIAMQFLVELNRDYINNDPISKDPKLPFNFSKIGKWWRRGKEIDIVALNESTGDILLCECKWRNRKTDVDTLSNLMDKSVSVDWGVKDRNGNRYFAAISKSGFTKKAEEFAKENDFLLFTLDDF